MPEAFQKYGFVEKIKSFVPGTHFWLDRLPEPYRSKAIIFGYKLGLVPSFGYIKIQNYTDDTFKEKIGNPTVNCNIITNTGATKMRDIIEASFDGAGINNQVYHEFGIGTATPVVTNTDINSALTNTARLQCTVTPIGSYEIRTESFLNGTYGNGHGRPYTINEFGIFSSTVTHDCVAHALVSPGHLMTGAGTAKATYGILVR